MRLLARLSLPSCVVAVLAAMLAPPVSALAAADGPPPAVYLVHSIEPGKNVVDLGVADVAAGRFTPVLDDMPSATYGLAVHPASGRWAMSFLQLPNGDALILDGKPASKPNDVAVIVVGEVGKGVTLVLAGDPKCTNVKTACFETPVGFAADGAVLLTQSVTSSSWAWSRRIVVAGAKPAAILPKALAKVASFAVSPDGARAAYVLGGAIYVTAWPAQPADPKKAAAVVKAGKVAVKPSLLMSEVAIFGDLVFYFRREPKEQKRGWIEAWDLTGKKATTVFELPEDYPMWNGRFLWSSSRKSVLFQHDATYGRGDVYEVALADLQARRRFADAHQLLDVSPDGRWVLYAAYTAPDRGDRADNPEVLVVFDLETGAEVARAASGVPGARFEHAYFVAPAP